MHNRKNIKYRCFTDTQFEGIYFLCFKCDGYLKQLLLQEMVVTDQVSTQCRDNSLARQNQHKKCTSTWFAVQCLIGHGLHPFQESTNEL